MICGLDSFSISLKGGNSGFIDWNLRFETLRAMLAEGGIIP
jgi:hypothetical protein